MQRAQLSPLTVSELLAQCNISGLRSSNFLGEVESQAPDLTFHEHFGGVGGGEGWRHPP